MFTYINRTVTVSKKCKSVFNKKGKNQTYTWEIDLFYQSNAFIKMINILQILLPELLKTGMEYK